MPMYTGIDGTLKELPEWYAGIDGTVKKVIKFPVAVDGTQYTIYLTSNVAITVTIQNQIVGGCFPNDSASAQMHTKVLVNDKTICVIPDQLCAGTFTDTEDIKKGGTFQLDIRYESAPTEVYLNGDNIYTGGTKEDDNPTIMTLQANGNADVVITVTGTVGSGATEVVKITGDVIATDIPPLPEG